jgi:hypothetical protein
MVLWHTEVEGQKPAAVAPLLGVSPNAVSALSHRAREGLRAAFVTMHVQDAVGCRPACQATRTNLGAYIRASLSTREARRVSAHLECCRPCTAVYLELVEVDHDLRGVLAPMLLGGAGAAYLSGLSVQAGVSAAVGGFLHSVPFKALAASTAAGVALGGLVVGGMALFGGGPDARQIADPPAATAPQQIVAGGKARPARPAKPKPTALSTPSSAPASTPANTPAQPPSTPAQHPSSGNGHEHDDGAAHGQVTQHEEPPASSDPTEVDVGVTASRAGLGPASTVTVNVTGLSPTQSGVVTITSDQPAATLHLDPRCDLVGVNRATCRISGAGLLEFTAGTLPLTSTTLTITATPAEGLHDQQTGDNTARVVLDGRV